MDDSGAAAFVQEARSLLSRRQTAARARLHVVLGGPQHILVGGRFDESEGSPQGPRSLGWSAHWLLTVGEMRA